MKKIAFLLLIILEQGYSQSWDSLSTLNSCTNRHENTLAAVRNQLVLVGGRGIKPTEVFDISTKTWTKFADTPLEMNHCQAVTFKNEVYILGAFMGKYPHEVPIPNVYIFNVKKGEWRKGAEIPKDRLRGSAGCVVYKDKIYLVCGIQDGHWDGHVAWFDEYDPITNTWKKLIDAPHSRDHISVAVIKNKLYIAGGRRSTARINQVLNLTEAAVDVYDFGTNTWQTLPDSLNLPSLRAGNSAVAFGHKLLIIGGESPSQVPSHADCEALDTQKMKWQPLPKLHQGRHGTGAVNVSGKIYTVAGSGNRGGGPELNSIEVLK